MSDADQLEQKLADLATAWTDAGMCAEDLREVKMHAVAPGGLRDRVDLTLHREPEGMCLGLYDLERKRIVDMETCPMMSDRLREWLHTFRAHIPDMRLGSVRLRIAPDGSRGIWLDFPNAEITRFLDERSWLKKMMSMAHVEMGQRRMVLRRKEDGRLDLGDPQPKAWFETYLGEGAKPQPLYCSVGGFTQVGFAANRALVELVRMGVSEAKAEHWLELGSGIGNFTLPLAAEGYRVTALENDARANDGLRRGAEEAGLSENITIEQANMHRKDTYFAQLLGEVDAVLADPPRSGLRAFVDVLEEMEPASRPQHFLYVSCFAKSLTQDLARLFKLGYKAESIEGLDQFPQSHHCEWIVRLVKT